MKSERWAEIAVIIVLGASAWLFQKVIDLNARLNTIEGSFKTFIDLRREVGNLQKDVGKVQSDIDTLRSATVRIIEVPSSGAGPDSVGMIAGKVEGLQDPQQYKMVIYAFTNMWYVQPTRDNALTAINPDGSWSNSTHLGSAYAALVVKPTYKPPFQAESLPNGDGMITFSIKEAR